MQEYFLCSSSVIEHFSNLKKSKPFKSGYSHDYEDLYFVIATDDYESIEKYYKEVIEPFNEKSNVTDIDFWVRECCDSLLDAAPKGCITKCKAFGVFKAIENIWGLTNEKHRAFAIYKMAEYYDVNPIEFINKV